MKKAFIAALSCISAVTATHIFEHPKICSNPGISYDDVLIVPNKSDTISRRNASTQTKLTRNISLNIPVVSSNMDTVTESTMAIRIAQLGGIGIIHRFNTIDQQVQEVLKVKRFTNTIIEDPLTIHMHKTIGEAMDIMHEYAITSALVTDDNDKLVGIITARDLWFNPDESIPVSKRMTPREKLVVASKTISSKDAKDLLLKHRIEKLPLITDDWHIAGLITSKDIYKKHYYPNAALDNSGSLLVGAAIGVKEDSIDRAKALVQAGVDVLVIDIAHGHSILAIDVVKEIKHIFPHIDVIAGNVATAEGTRALIEAGADAIKVGVGPGSICTTRITTGSGYPQLSAILQCATEAAKHDVPIIADGGIKNSGDIAKALVAGAHTVMLGSLLAGTKEAPGLPFIKNGKKFKVIRGMASFGANLGREVNERKNTSLKGIKPFVPEGVEAIVPYKGEVLEILTQLIGGLLSGMSYCGATTIDEMHQKGRFVRMTSSGLRESHAHDVIVA